MVKKISGSGSGASGTTRVQSTKTVESGKVTNVGQVQATDKQRAANAVEALTSGLSRKHREQLLQLVDEEADKIFGAEVLPNSKKETVKGAVKMVIAASLIEEPEAEKKK